MSRALTFLAWLALGGAAQAAPVALNYKDHVGDYISDSFTVLDLSIDKGSAMVKVVAHSNGGPAWGESIDCKYPGMTATPTSGVTLTSWDLKAGSPGAPHVVYALAMGPEECSSEATNATNLADAKAEAARLGLDVTRKPAPVVPTDGTFALTVAGAAVRVTADVKTTYGPDMDPGTSVLTLTTGDGRVVYSATGDGVFVVRQAFVEGTKAVFAVQTSGLWGQHYFFLTAPVELGGPAL